MPDTDTYETESELPLSIRFQSLVQARLERVGGNATDDWVRFQQEDTALQLLMKKLSKGEPERIIHFSPQSWEHTFFVDDEQGPHAQLAGDMFRSRMPTHETIGPAWQQVWEKLKERSPVQQLTQHYQMKIKRYQDERNGKTVERKLRTFSLTESPSEAPEKA